LTSASRSAQIRLQISTFTGYPGEPESFTNTHLTADPRFSLQYRLTTRVALKGALGLRNRPRRFAVDRRVRQPTWDRSARPTVAGIDVDHDHAAVEARVLEATCATCCPGRAGPGRDGERRTRARRRRDPVAPAALFRFFGWIAYTLSRSEHGSPR
jgi:hypothetical protein